MVLENGYETKTTFWNDFTIADYYGEEAVENTFERAFKEWKNNYEYLTELVIVLNLKIWQHWENNDESLAKIYNDLWQKADNYACENLKGEELSYFYRITD